MFRRAKPLLRYLSIPNIGPVVSVSEFDARLVTPSCGPSRHFGLASSFRNGFSPVTFSTRFVHLASPSFASAPADDVEVVPPENDSEDGNDSEEDGGKRKKKGWRVAIVAVLAIAVAAGVVIVGYGVEKKSQKDSDEDELRKKGEDKQEISSIIADLREDMQTMMGIMQQHLDFHNFVERRLLSPADRVTDAAWLNRTMIGGLSRAAFREFLAGAEKQMKVGNANQSVLTQLVAVRELFGVVDYNVAHGGFSKIGLAAKTMSFRRRSQDFRDLTSVQEEGTGMLEETDRLAELLRVCCAEIRSKVTRAMDLIADGRLEKPILLEGLKLLELIRLVADAHEFTRFCVLAGLKRSETEDDRLQVVLDGEAYLKNGRPDCYTELSWWCEHPDEKPTRIRAERKRRIEAHREVLVKRLRGEEEGSGVGFYAFDSLSNRPLQRLADELKEKYPE